MYFQLENIQSIQSQTHPKTIHKITEITFVVGKLKDSKLATKVTKNHIKLWKVCDCCLKLLGVGLQQSRQLVQE